MSAYQAAATPWYRSKKLKNYSWRYLALFLVLIFFLFPLFWLATLAVKTPNEYFGSPPVWLPSEPSLVHLKALLKSVGVDSFFNSLIIASGATLLALVVGCPAAYSMARYKTGGDNFALWVLSQRMLPPIVIVLPIFILFRTLRWQDTYHGLIVLYAVFNLPYVIWMMRGYFQDVPTEVEDSALVDGCNPLQAMWYVTLPLSIGGLLTTAVFTFIFSWNEFLFALVLTRVNAIPITVEISGMFGSQSAFLGQVSWLSWISLLPVFVMTILIQRYLVRGMTLGAVR
jgi:multiple sugar transport system permease protein